MAYTRTWDVSYEATPADSSLAKLVGARIRDLKLDIRERMEQEHYYGTSEAYGGHKFGYGTTTARDVAITAPKVGMVWYNTTYSAWQVYNGSAWISAGDYGIGTTATRDAIASPPTNFKWLSTDEGFHAYYSGSAWVTLAPKGLFHGRVAYEGLDTITISRGNQANLRLEVDGVLLASVADITLDLSSAGDRQSGVSQTPSTWYYIYGFNSSGALDFLFSDRAPVMDPASGKVGYHDGGGTGGSTSWRCIGAVFCNSATNIQPFDYNPNTGLWTFRSIVSAFTKSPGLTQQSNYTTVSLSGNLPATARMVRIQVSVQQENSRYYYGHESLTGAVATTPAVNYLLLDIASNDNNPTNSDQFDIAVDSTPAIAWGNVMVKVENADEHSLDPIGWYDDLGIIS